MMGAMRALAVLGVVLLGCGSEPKVRPGDAGVPDARPDGPGDVAALIGGSDGTVWQPLDEGADAALHAGAQGGFHVFLHLRTRGLAAGLVTIERVGRRVRDGKVVTRARDRKQLDLAQGEWLQITEPMLVFMCPSPIGIGIMDEAIRYELDLTDAEMRTVHVERTITPRCPEEADQRAFCERICVG
jgi:hypothetical protein